jgi:hypothetical protein
MIKQVTNLIGYVCRRNRIRHRASRVITAAGLGIAVACLLATSASAERISIPFTAEKGDTFKVRITKKSTEVENGATTTDGPYSFNYDAVVLDASASGSRIRWTLTSAFMPGTKTENELLSGGMLTLMKGIPLEFDAGPSGAPVRIPNFRKIVPRLVEITREVLIAQGREPDEDAMRIIEETFRNMSPWTAASTYLPEAQLIGAMQNLTLDTEGAVRREQKAPKPFGGPEVSMISEVRLAEHDTTNGFSLITWQTRFDRESMVKSIMKTADTIGKRAGKNLPPEALEMASKMELDRNDEGKALVSLADGWVRKLYYHQRISNAVMGQSHKKDETWLIEIDRSTK